MASYILQCLFYLILAKNDIRCNPPFSPYGARISKSIFIAYGWFPRTRSHMVMNFDYNVICVINYSDICIMFLFCFTDHHAMIKIIVTIYTM